jgi:hypothetical protein
MKDRFWRKADIGETQSLLSADSVEKVFLG